jgi:hypothetical protein
MQLSYHDQYPSTDLGIPSTFTATQTASSKLSTSAVPSGTCLCRLQTPSCPRHRTLYRPRPQHSRLSLLPHSLNQCPNGGPHIGAAASLPPLLPPPLLALRHPMVIPPRERHIPSQARSPSRPRHQPYSAPSGACSSTSRPTRPTREQSHPVRSSTSSRP